MVVKEVLSDDRQFEMRRGPPGAAEVEFDVSRRVGGRQRADITKDGIQFGMVQQIHQRMQRGLVPGRGSFRDRFRESVRTACSSPQIHVEQRIRTAQPPPSGDLHIGGELHALGIPLKSVAQNEGRTPLQAEQVGVIVIKAGYVGGKPG